MNIKRGLLIIKQNSLVIIWAAMLAVGLFYVINNPNSFTASVLSLSEKVFIAEKWWDIAYKTNSGYVDIFISERIEEPKNIVFTISFNKETIKIDPNNLSGQGTRIIKSLNWNEITIEVIPSPNRDKNQSILLLPFTWEREDILLSEATMKLSNGTQKSLSIGSLNETIWHSE